MSESTSKFEQVLKDLFPLRSQIKRELKPRTAKFISITGDLIDGMEKGGDFKMLKLIKEQLPKDAYLLDNTATGAVFFPLPCFTATGTGSWTDNFGIVFGSDEWDTKPEGYIFPRMNATFRKDPVTWAITCEIKEENDK